MAKLFFRYACMNAGKSLDIIRIAHNYEELGKRVLILTSVVDDRYGVGRVTSRVGVSREAVAVRPGEDVLEVVSNVHKGNPLDCVLVDEVHFFEVEQIDQLSRVVDDLGIPVITYGLRSDFTMKPFAASAILMAQADSIEELKTLCHCGRKATANARIVDGAVARGGEQVQVGGNESYVPLCRRHYRSGEFRPVNI